uniref:Uncharacterized protein n=1 Tax=Trichogramma kaykai TaxID=54128 RepID=A0ABD2WWK3_9HYME
MVQNTSNTFSYQIEREFDSKADENYTDCVLPQRPQQNVVHKECVRIAQSRIPRSTREYRIQNSLVRGIELLPTNRNKKKNQDQNDVRARGIPAVYHQACKETLASGGKITRDSEGGGGGGANSTIALLRVIFESAKMAISVQVVPVHAWLLLVVGAIDDLEAFVLYLSLVEYFPNVSLDQGNRHPILGQLYTLAQELDAIAEAAYLLDAHVTDTLVRMNTKK